MRLFCKKCKNGRIITESNPKKIKELKEDFKEIHKHIKSFYKK